VPFDFVGCVHSIAVACATARLSMCLLADQWYRPGFKSRPGSKLDQANSGIYAVGLIFWAVKISINLVPVQARKVTVGLASHSPCVTDNSGTGTTTYGLTASDGR